MKLRFTVGMKFTTVALSIFLGSVLFANADADKWYYVLYDRGERTGMKEYFYYEADMNRWIVEHPAITNVRAHSFEFLYLPKDGALPERVKTMNTIRVKERDRDFVVVDSGTEELDKADFDAQVSNKLTIRNVKTESP